VAHEKFQVDVLSPEGLVWSGEAEMVSTRTATGSIGLLANHAPLLGMLDPTELRIYESESEVIRFAQGEGYVQVGGNRALLLVEEGRAPNDLDASDLRDRLQRAERGLESADEDSEEARVADRDKRRWETFLELAEGS
jgi:F-type H+-transporting ATPase subunit epsilon